jgi:hypothetical protein
MKKTLDTIETIAILVQFEDGSAHQVLARPGNKKLAVEMLARLEGKLTLDKELLPIEFKTV